MICCCLLLSYHISNHPPQQSTHKHSQQDIPEVCLSIYLSAAAASLACASLFPVASMPSLRMIPKTRSTETSSQNNSNHTSTSAKNALEEEFAMMETNSFDMTMDDFDDSYDDHVLIDEDDDFDPFHIGEVIEIKRSKNRVKIDSREHNTNDTPTVIPVEETHQQTTSSSCDGNDVEFPSPPGTPAPAVLERDTMSVVSTSAHSVRSTTSTATIPPKMLVKFKIHEEVSSESSLVLGNEGRSEVFVVGTVMAQIMSSDALKNAPFVLSPSITRINDTVDQDQNIINVDKKLDFVPNDKYTKEYLMTGGNNSRCMSKMNVVKIPKDILGFVTVGKYHMKTTVDHMPLLLEQKVVRSKSKIQIAVQVRSKLTNPDDLSEFSIVVSIPPRINGNSVAVVSGAGTWDRWKRTITWELEHLPKGQSFMVSAKCALDDTAESPEVAKSNEGLKFPVMLRCCSNDQISNTRFDAVEASGFPASISSSTVGRSFRIVHRLK